jgi:hypothetical protein
VLRALVVGDSRYVDRALADGRKEYVRELAASGVDVLDLTLHPSAASGDAVDGRTALGWETSARLVALAGPGAGAHPELILAWDPLHAAVASRVKPGVPWILHFDEPSMAQHVASPACAALLPGLHDVLAGAIQGAHRCIAHDPAVVRDLQDSWNVAPSQIVLVQPTLRRGATAPAPGAADALARRAALDDILAIYARAARQPPTQDRQEHLWWVAAWNRLRVRGATGAATDQPTG